MKTLNQTRTPAASLSQVNVSFRDQGGGSYLNPVDACTL